MGTNTAVEADSFDHPNLRCAHLCFEFRFGKSGNKQHTMLYVVMRITGKINQTISFQNWQRGRRSMHQYSLFIFGSMHYYI